MPGRERAILPFRFLMGKQSFVPGTALANHLGRCPLFVAEGKNQETNKSAEYEGNYPEKVHGRISQAAVDRCQAAWTAVVFVSTCRAEDLNAGSKVRCVATDVPAIDTPAVSLPCAVNSGSRLCEAHAASAQGREVGSEKGKTYRVRDN
ncbi:hypothetical protein R4P70_30280 [Rhodococcus sp. IEGM 1241]|uniref:hypothetical protein n=1 Tax=Rhodococcus sp. IEGM 1241 TaxID=3082228 RepID=UPI0029541FF9|nr:hypothetical protein [Rhodococcus sp. IEGM 1241]MDV8015614.1 hypothetical protein [Rhodococcus sp. IEGM 1241]